MSNREEEIRKLIDEVTVMQNGIEILESIVERNFCDSHTIDAIFAFLKHFRRFKKKQKQKETIASNKWWKEHEEWKATRRATNES